jgi:hypothetical protein
MGSRTWIKVYCNKWLEGTLREETPAIRSVWIDLLALAGDGQYGDTGEIKLTNGVSFTDKQIAEILHIPTSLWRRAKARFIETERIKVTPKGVISIINWTKYQSEYERQKPYRERKPGSLTPEPEIPLNNPPIEIEKEKESEKLQYTVITKSYNEKDTPPPETPSQETPSIGVSTTQPPVSNTPPMSLPLSAPKGGKAEANSLTNGHAVPPREDRATLESDPSTLGGPSKGLPKATYRLRIIKFLDSYGSASIKTIAQATGIEYNAVNLALHNGKDKVFRHWSARGQYKWGLM